MGLEGVEIEYKKFMDSSNSRWEYANKILYDLCKYNPRHDDEHVIVAKVWLIGRSYAAAIERGRDSSGSSEDFYYDVVAPKMMEESFGTKILDKNLDILRQSENSIADDLELILSTHKNLTDKFGEISSKKRSLASKYLHFHCPDKFFIYDSRADAAVKDIVDIPDRSKLKGLVYDSAYGNFVCRMIKLQEKLRSKLNCSDDYSPRKMDTFLLTWYKSDK